MIKFEEDFDEKVNPFDVVCALEVVEHVDSPQTFLAECCRLIKVRKFLSLGHLII
jgi:2-polyprenyl-3-methyl-5-hydroxy-6-metoxy-1,4-benzoquinol methylase